MRRPGLGIENVAVVAGGGDYEHPGLFRGRHGGVELGEGVRSAQGQVDDVSAVLDPPS
jgi:hypothetical protein